MTSNAVRPLRARGSRRPRGVLLVLTALLLVVIAASLVVGPYPMSLGDLAATLVGHGDAGSTFVVWDLRVPRLALGIVAGAALALSGGLYQALLRNPLASPDIIGITGGASVAAVYAIVVLGASGAVLSGFAFAGAVVAALAVYALAWRDGISGYRFALIGIAVAFVASGVLSYLMTRGNLDAVQDAVVWLAGSIGNVSWQTVGVTAVLVAVLLPFVVAFAPRLRVLQLGDDLASGLGVRPERVRVTLLVVGAGLAAVATAAAGPIAFIAFMSAPIARRLVRDGSLALTATALTGVLIVLAGDFVGQNLFGAVQVPVGVVTGAVGAPYLLWQLATTNSRGKGA
ncbi:iron chelate uptake ABC transporter family permease subunit [Cellulomonas sp. PhB143]|uniref:FecCD family ABC transporter permease n=1 Tax=Cellulomonas sp. PhB143 TaxID=2485186 RepID=UPI000F9C3C6A|nr:iron chelate uptake ABC transporter family permease subunit [Cellulomonas sp. PhB143]ROS75561.1 iron complex transport system permease protein [Cellulomonas sp. PhB143]